MRVQGISKHIDWFIIALYATLVFLGWINIYAATVTENTREIFDFTTLYGKQLQWIGLSFLLIFFIISIDSKFYERFSGVFYVISIISLIGLFVFGSTINGATSWYNFGSFSLQPSEFAKAATILALANFLNEPNFDLTKLKSQISTFVLILIPAILIVLQPDAGSALIYFSLVIVLYREGLPAYYLVIGLVAIVLFTLTLYAGFTTSLLLIYGSLTLFFAYIINFRNIKLKRDWLKIIGLYIITGLFMYSVDYVFNNVFEQRHRDRFSILLGQTSDTKGIGYNTDQSMITIGSGGLTGKGFLEGDRTQGNFVPEQHTDYIFSTVGEEWGFLGSSAVIILFIALFIRLIHMAEKQKSTFSRVFGYSVASILFFHFLINIGMVIGLLPTIGIPLPFFSYGGSSLWGFTILLFIFIRLDADKTYEW